MKRKLFTIGAMLILTAGINAQTDTLTSFFTGSLHLYGLDQVAPRDSGFVMGNNAFGDLAKMQRFDNTHGVISGGTITGALLAVPYKRSAGGSFQVAIWDDVSGVPSTTPLATKNVTLAAVDTNHSVFHQIGSAGVYNLSVQFTTPVNIPTLHNFWVGVILPSTSGDSIAILHNANNDFADALTNTGELRYDMSFHSVAETQQGWGLNAAMCIFPIVHFVGAGVEEMNSTSISMYPNPASDIINFDFNNTAVSHIEIIALDGKQVYKQLVDNTKASVNISNWYNGIYIYKVVTQNGAVFTDKFVKK